MFTRLGTKLPDLTSTHNLLYTVHAFQTMYNALNIGGYLFVMYQFGFIKVFHFIHTNFLNENSCYLETNKSSINIILYIISNLINNRDCLPILAVAVV